MLPSQVQHSLASMAWLWSRVLRALVIAGALLYSMSQRPLYLWPYIVYTRTRTYYIVMGTGCEATCTCVYAISYANGLAMAEPRTQLQLHCDRHSRYSRIIHMQMSDILTGFSFNLFDKVYRRRLATLCNTLGNYVRLACTSSRQKVSVIIDKCDTNTNIIYSILTVSN